MDQYKLAIAMMAVTDSPEELDALADFGWHLPDLKGVMATCAQAMRWRPRATSRLDPTPLPSATAPSQG
jgi:hypothetical protein